MSILIVLLNHTGRERVYPAQQPIPLVLYMSMLLALSPITGLALARGFLSMLPSFVLLASCLLALV